MYLCPIFVNKTFPNFTVQNENTFKHKKKPLRYKVIDSGVLPDPLCLLYSKAEGKTVNQL